MVIKEDIGAIRVLRLANPPSNVLTQGLLSALRKEVAEAARESSVRCLILASSYPRYFSTGLDLGELTALPLKGQAECFENLIGLYRELLSVPKPTVAAISGTAILGGWIAAMACDFRLISDDGRIALSEIRAGLSPTALLIGRLQDMSSSPVLAKDMVLRGKTLRAEQALAGGFVDAVIPAQELEAEALSQAKSLIKLPPGGYARVKAALNARQRLGDDSFLASCREEVLTMLETPEVQEGLAALRDKRRPRWEKADV